MQSKIQEVNGLTIDFSKSSIEIFPAIKGLADSHALYLKFCKNRIKTLDLQNHAELLMDFDLCMIDKLRDETIIQLFAIFVISKQNEPVNKWEYIADAVGFARSMIVDEIRTGGLKDMSGADIIVPAFIVTPQSINHNM